MMDLFSENNNDLHKVYYVECMWYFFRHIESKHLTNLDIYILNSFFE